MDENVSKAFIIVAGILISVSLVSLLTFAMGKVRGLAENQDDEVEIEQTEIFNKEYEAYEKDLMYGIDVLSCLGKAKSNNDKVSNKYGEKMSADYEVKVEIDMASPYTLTESISIWYNDPQKSGTLIEYTNGEKPVNNKEGQTKTNEERLTTYKQNKLGAENINFTFFNATDKFSEFGEDDEFMVASKSVTIKKFFLQLYPKNTNEVNQNENARKLLASITRLSEVIENDVEETKDMWAKAEYRSIAYDFKTKKFKCTGVEYNEKNGRINLISFKEY